MATTEDIIINVEMTGADAAEKSIDGVTKSLSDQGKAAEKTTDENAEYSGQLVESIKDTQVFGVSINSLTKSFKGVVTTIKSVNIGLKAFKIALVATGIGAIVVALGSLVAVLTKTQGGMNLVTKAVNAMSTVLDVVIDRFIMFGNGLISFFSGDFGEGIDQMAASFKGLGEEISNEVTATNELSDAFAALETAKIANIVADAKLSSAAKAAEAIAKDTDQNIKVRIAASREALELEGQRAAQTIALAEEELRILKARNELGTSTNEDLRAEAELEAEVYRLKEENNSREIAFRADLNSLIASTKEKEVELVTETEDQIIKTVKASYQEQSKLIEGNLAENIKAAELKKKNAEALAASELAINQAKAEGELETAAGVAGAIAGLLGQEAEAGKAFAAAQALINMFLAISKANTLGFPAAIPGIIIATATGLKAIRDINAVPVPKVQVVSTPFADGGDINGPGHGRGGVWLNAEGGEYIVNKSAMRDPVNRAIIEGINNGQSRGNMYAQGGNVDGSRSIDFLNIEKAIANNRGILVLEDLDIAQSSVRVREEISTLGE